MTDQGPRSLLPGASLRAPYGMTPGVRAVLPGVNDGSATAWNRYPEPDKIDLDAPNQPTPGVAAATEAPAQESLGWVLTDPNGNAVHIRSDAHKKRDADTVQKLGQALAAHAVSPEEQAAAQRAVEWGMAQVGVAGVGDITKQMTHRWDTDTGGILKTNLQEIRSKANRGGKGGVPNALGPTKQEKFDYGLDKDLNDRVSQVIQQERQGGKAMALAELENTLGQMEAKLASGNSMAERIAVQQELLALTGKASRESEQAAITGSAGKWEELKNKLSLWTSNDPNLSRAYVQKFRGMLAAERAQLRRQKEQLGIQAATRMMGQARQYGPEQAQLAADTVYGSLTGNFRGESYKPPGAAAPQPAPVKQAPVADPNADLYGP